MTKGFAPPRPWQCRIYQGQRIHTSLKIGTVDGTTITRSNALKTAKIVTALLQEPTNTDYQCGLARHLGDDAAKAFMALATELGDVFKVVMVSPDGHVTAEGYSQKAAALERAKWLRLGVKDEIRSVDPRRVV